MTVTGENENNIKGEKGEIIIMESNKSTKEFYDHAPLAAPEDDDSDDNLIDDEAHYSQINENQFALINQTSNNQLFTFSHDPTTNKSKLRHRRDKGQQST